LIRFALRAFQNALKKKKMSQLFIIQVLSLESQITNSNGGFTSPNLILEINSDGQFSRLAFFKQKIFFKKGIEMILV